MDVKVILAPGSHYTIASYWNIKLIANGKNRCPYFLFPFVIGRADNVPDNLRMDEPT